MMLPRHLFVGLVVAHATAAADDDNVAKWTVKGGFIPGTKDDVETGFMTVAAAKKRCEQLSKCVAITFHAKADVETEVHVYLKQDSTVSETDKAWTSMVKRPAGLMDVNFMNELAFPLELCWIDLVGSAPPICYGTVQPGSSKNLSSYAGHNFVLKRLVWSLTAPAAALATAASASADPEVARLLAASDSEGEESGGGGGGGGPIAITARQRAYEWESPLALTGGGAEVAQMASITTNATASAVTAVTTMALVAVELINQLPQPAEVCTVPRWASRLLQASMPEGLETCHGVVAAGGKFTVSGVDVESVLLARQLVGVTTITKGVINYSLTQQQLSADLMRRMVRAMGVGGAGTPLPPVRGTPPPPAKPPPVRPHRPPVTTPPPPPPGSQAAGGGGGANGGIGAVVTPVEWVPLLGTAATVPASLRGRCPGIYAGEPTASVAASASALMPRLLAAALARPLPPPSCDDASCRTLAATAGVPLDAGDAGALAPSVARSLRMLREQAPHLARAVGAAPLVVLAAVSAPGMGGGGAVGHTGTKEAAEAAEAARAARVPMRTPLSSAARSWRTR